jgi:energy-coupling factor transport system permease protein
MTPAAVHPWAWWGWAICLAGVASLTSNPLLLTLLAAVITAVVLMRRSAAPWARSVGAYFTLAAFVIGMRVFFQVLIGGSYGDHLLFTLPEIPLPDWAAGIRLGGPVTAEALLYTVYDAARLAVMLLCLGAANSLANPRKALRSVPAALYEASVAVVIALSVAPQLIESAQRVHRARRLRGNKAKGLRGVPALVIPVLGDAIDRSITLAAGMESRGFARTLGKSSKAIWALLLVSMMGASLGAFLLLGTTSVWLAAALLLLGIAGMVIGLRQSGKRLRATQFNPHPWRRRDTTLLGLGLAALSLTAALANVDRAAMNTSTSPLAWPDLTIGMIAILALTAAVLLPTAPVKPQQRQTAGIVGVRRGLRAEAVSRPVPVAASQGAR